MKSSTLFLGRGSLLGDICTYLPVLTLIEKVFPNSSKTFFINKKCSQILPLLANHSLIDRIYIGEHDEGLGPNDIEFIKKHSHYLEVNPEHRRWDWYNDEVNSPNMVMENFNMLGLNWRLLNDNELIPKLIKWFDVTKTEKCISVWPFAGYFRDKSRSPSVEYWERLFRILLQDGYKIQHFGHFNEFDYSSILGGFGYTNQTKLPFFEQIKLSLGCDINLGTDSGSSLILGGYGMPQITLLTDWMPNHYCNFNVLEPRNKNNISLFAKGGCDNIPQEEVLQKIKLLV